MFIVSSLFYVKDCKKQRITSDFLMRKVFKYLHLRIIDERLNSNPRTHQALFEAFKSYQNECIFA